MADDVGSSHVRTDFGELSDAELVRATRDGSRRAYAALWKRHSVSALKYARTLTTSDADDVVSEAFLKVYAAIKAGRGPEEDFRFYIRSAVRNTHVSILRARRTAPAGDAIEDVIGDRGADIASEQSFDGAATARAFLSLPTRWQEVLWYTEVEQLSRERTASLLGMNPNAVSALSFRAREALRTAWLQQHISAHSDLDRGCGIITPLLGAYSRQGVSRRDRLRVEHHLNGCAHCTAVVSELSELLTPGRLALLLLPVILTGGGFAAFASKFGAGSAAAASASTIAPPAATLVATVSGSSAATGAAALSVVGKVAACALVATMIVPPTQMLFGSVNYAAPARHASTSSDATPDGTPPHPDPAAVRSELAGHDRAGSSSETSTHDDTDAGDTGEPAHGEGGNANSGRGGNSGGNANSGGNGNSGGNANLSGNANANPGSNAGGNATGSGKANSSANADSTGTPNANANANAKSKSNGSASSNAGGNGNGNANPGSNAGGNGNGSASSNAGGNAGGNANPGSNAGGNGNSSANANATSHAGGNANPGSNAGGNGNSSVNANPDSNAGDANSGSNAGGNGNSSANANPNSNAGDANSGSNAGGNGNSSANANPNSNAGGNAGSNAGGTPAG